MKNFLLALLLFACSKSIYSQQNVGIGTTMPHNSSILELTSTSKGVLIPRMTSGERTSIGSPATGLLVYDMTTQSFWYRSSTAWINLNTSTKLVDADGDTKVDVEETPDEDIIRMDVAGTEVLAIQKNANGDVLIKPGAIEKNIFMGRGTGNVNTGFSNTVVGDSAFVSNTSGSRNTANGFRALRVNTSGVENTAIGYDALRSNTNGQSNTAIGCEALFSNTGSFFNTAIGKFSMYYNTTGGDNTAAGKQSLFFNSTGDFNVALGSNALHTNIAGSNGVAIGFRSQFNANNTSTPWDNTNTSIGCQSLNGSITLANNTGTGNTAIGRNTLYDNSSGDNNTATGYFALNNNTTGNLNTASGSQALNSNTIGSENTAIGNSAMFTSTGGQSNTAIGSEALYSTTSAFFNTAIGKLAMYYNTIGGDNTAIGKQALYFNSTGDLNTAIGSNALHANKAGSNGVAIGFYSQVNANNTTTAWDNTNTSVGYHSLHGSTPPSANTGAGNTAIGRNTMYGNSTGANNTAVGYNALNSNTSGSNNTVVGFDAGGNQTTGGNCTFLGYSAEGDAGTYTNAMAIGYQAEVIGSNEVRIGNSTISEIGGYEPWTHISDGRYKKNISENVNGLDFILKLRPVTYNLEVNKLASHLREDFHHAPDGREVYKTPDAITQQSRDQKENKLYTGFVAQEVEVAAQSLGYDFSGVATPDTKDDLYGLSYSEFVVPLVKAVQEQQVMITTQQEMIQSLLDQNKVILQDLHKLRSQMSVLIPSGMESNSIKN